MKTKEKIFEAATKKFSETGYNIATMRDIAAVVGITEGGIYRHYGCKEEILEDILDTFKLKHNACLMSKQEINKAIAEYQAPGEILACFVSYLFDNSGQFIRDTLRIINRENQTHANANILLNQMYIRLYELARHMLDLLVQCDRIPKLDTNAFALSLSQLMISTAQRWASCYQDEESADRVIADYQTICGLMIGVAVNGRNVSPVGVKKVENQPRVKMAQS